MSTASITTVNTPASPAMRIWNVARLHFANPWTTLYWPWAIMAMIFVANWAIAWILQQTLPPGAAADASEGMSFNGGATFIFVYMMVVAIQAIAVTFPFALGYGTTRRDFYLGSALTFVLLAVVYSIALGLLSLVERATGGWGVSLYMLSGAIFGNVGWLPRVAIYLALFLFFFFVGAAIAGIWVRWKAQGLSAFFVAFGLLLVGGAVLLTFTESWLSFGEFFVYWGYLGSYLWLLLPAAVAAVAGFFVLRGATPRE